PRQISRVPGLPSASQSVPSATAACAITPVAGSQLSAVQAFPSSTPTGVGKTPVAGSQPSSVQALPSSTPTGSERHCPPWQRSFTVHRSLSAQSEFSVHCSWQLALQLPWFGGSQLSTPEWINPSPQKGSAQVSRQSSVLIALPS